MVLCLIPTFRRCYLKFYSKKKLGLHKHQTVSDTVMLEWHEWRRYIRWRIHRKGWGYVSGIRIVPHAEQEGQDEHIATAIMDSPLDVEETRKALQRAKLGKATGIEKIPNEILKQPNLLYALHHLYFTCYDKNIIPSMWYTSILSPILKKGKYSRYPLNDKLNVYCC